MFLSSPWLQPASSVISWRRTDLTQLAWSAGAIQGHRISEWLNSATDTDDLKNVVNPLTFAVYGSVLIWLKSYLRETGRKLIAIGIDLPNTLNPRDDLEQLSTDIEILDPIVKPEVDALRQSLAFISGESAVVSSTQWGNWTQLLLRQGTLWDYAVKITIDGGGPRFSPSFAGISSFKK